MEAEARRGVVPVRHVDAVAEVLDERGGSDVLARAQVGRLDERARAPALPVDKVEADVVRRALGRRDDVDVEARPEARADRSRRPRGGRVTGDEDLGSPRCGNKMLMSMSSSTGESSIPNRVSEGVRVRTVF